MKIILQNLNNVKLRKLTSILFSICIFLIYFFLPQNIKSQALTGRIETEKGLCSPESMGDLVIIASGGVQPYSVVWSDGSTDPILKNAGPGTYSATLTDNLGTEVKIPEFIFGPPEPLLNIVLNVNIPNTCSGSNNGKIVVSGSGGGGGPYTFSWSNSQTNHSNTAANLAPGDYTVTVLDIWGCQVSETFTVTQPQPLVIENTQRSPSCPVCEDGELRLSPMGGTFPYQISVDGGNTYSNNFVFPNLAVGNYSFILRDSKNCKLTRTIAVKYEPPPCTSPVAIQIYPSAYYVSVFWSEPKEPTRYYVSWRLKKAGNAWRTVAINFTPPNYIQNYSIGGLDPNKEYEVRFRARCGPDSLSPWSKSYEFKTLAVPPPGCELPHDVSITPLKGEFLLKWGRVDLATRYFVSYRKKNTSSDWKTVTVLPTLEPKWLISGLDHGAEYEIRIRSRCDNALSSWSSIYSVTTLGFRQGSSMQNIQREIQIYPNPSEGIFYLQAEKEIKSIEIIDAVGKVYFIPLYQESGLDTESRSVKHYRLDLTSFSKGIYLIKILSDDQTVLKNIWLI